MSHLCPHCHHLLDVALHDNPALSQCPDCGGVIGNEISDETEPVPAEITTEPAPSFTRNTTPHPRPRENRWQWAALIALALLLGVQILLADREHFGADATWRPVLNVMCKTFGCKLPPWREPQAFTMLSRDVRPSPDAPGTLLVQATFRNDARWSQPWPALQLSLSDADGRSIGARVFSANEYLDKSVTQTELSPGQSAQVSLRLREPETPTSSFTFDFR
jgi:Zn-finger nucleic acid-binding protein